MLGAIRRFGHFPRLPAGWMVVTLITVGFVGGALTAGGQPQGRENSSAAASRSREPAASVQELASPPPDPVPAPQPSPAPAAASAPTEPVTADAAPPPVAPPLDPAPAEQALVRRPASAQPSPPEIRWTASAGPLDASAPVEVEIPALGVKAAVGPLGLNRDGTLEVPRDFSRAGWYTGRPAPGQAGPAIIVAHRASRRGPGAFWMLPEVQPGQEIVVTRADRRRVRFVVDRLEQHRKNAFPTEAVYGPTAETALRVITCGGPFEPSLGDHYRDNVIVFAHMTGWA